MDRIEKALQRLTEKERKQIKRILKQIASNQTKGFASESYEDAKISSVFVKAIFESSIAQQAAVFLFWRSNVVAKRRIAISNQRGCEFRCPEPRRRATLR
jgi:hypothetical protein